MMRLLLLILLPVAGFARPVARRVPARVHGLGVMSPHLNLSEMSAPSLLSEAPALLNAANGSDIVIPKDSLITAGEAPRVILPPEKKIIVPDAPTIEKPRPVIIKADRALTEEEQEIDEIPDQEALKALARSLTSEDDPNDRSAADGEMASSLSATFDGAAGFSGKDLDTVRAYFEGDARAPKLSQVEAAAHALFRGLLPAHYRSLPVKARYDTSENPSTGHLWSVESGHIIELAPAVTDSNGDVPSEFGLPNSTFVQEKVEQLLQFAHEYAHVVFDAIVRKSENHSPISSYAAMTEGFAVTLEQALVERILTNPMLLGLSIRDTADFVKIAQARSQWLAVLDNHNSEGVESWAKAFKAGGDQAVSDFLEALSSGRMTKTMRADPAYQLAVGDPQLLAGYLGKDGSSEIRLGLEAVAKAVGGSELDVEELRLAQEVVERAGPEGRRRVFMRSLFDNKRLLDNTERRAGSRWHDADAPLPLAIGPAFVLARLSAAAAEELAEFLAQAVSTQSGAKRLFGHPGPNEKLTALTAQAEQLPFSEKARMAWGSGLAQWLTRTAMDLPLIGQSIIIPGKDGVNNRAGAKSAFPGFGGPKETSISDGELDAALVGIAAPSAPSRFGLQLGIALFWGALIGAAFMQFNFAKPLLLILPVVLSFFMSLMMFTFIGHGRVSSSTELASHTRIDKTHEQREAVAAEFGQIADEMGIKRPDRINIMDSAGINAQIEGTWPGSYQLNATIALLEADPVVRESIWRHELSHVENNDNLWSVAMIFAAPLGPLIALVGPIGTGVDTILPFFLASLLAAFAYPFFGRLMEYRADRRSASSQGTAKPFLKFMVGEAADERRAAMSLNGTPFSGESTWKRRLLTTWAWVRQSFKIHPVWETRIARMARLSRP